MRDIIVIRGKCIFKTAKGHQFKEKKKKKREKRERQWRIRLERGVQNLEETIILQQPQLYNIPLDHVEVLIYFSSHTPLLTDRRDLKEHNPFDRTHHLNVSGKQKEIILQSSFGRRPSLSLPPLDHAHSWICGAPRCYLHSGRWTSEKFSPARFRAC